MTSYNSEAKNLAFKLWRQNGQNMEAALREMRKKGYMGLSRPTLDKWKIDGSWEERAARADAEEQRVSDHELAGDEKIVADLLVQKEKYDRYLASLPDNKIDNQATYAYASLLKTISSIQNKQGGDKPAMFIEFMSELVSYLMENDPSLAKLFDAHIEKFYAKVKAQA